jgi:fumarate reductase flavoprotein subunit
MCYTCHSSESDGIRINHKTEVLDRNNKVAAGLYAIGNDAGCMYGDTYDLLLSPGFAFGFAVNSGCIAGEAALRGIGKKQRRVIWGGRM